MRIPTGKRCCLRCVVFVVFRAGVRFLLLCSADMIRPVRRLVSPSCAEVYGDRSAQQRRCLLHEIEQNGILKNFDRQFLSHCHCRAPFPWKSAKRIINVGQQLRTSSTTTSPVTRFRSLLGRRGRHASRQADHSCAFRRWSTSSNRRQPSAGVQVGQDRLADSNANIQAARNVIREQSIFKGTNSITLPDKSTAVTTYNAALPSSVPIYMQGTRPAMKEDLQARLSR